MKWLSRLPVTEEIAGSSPVGPAKVKGSVVRLGLLLWADLSATGTVPKASVLGAESPAGACSENDLADKARSALVRSASNIYRFIYFCILDGTRKAVQGGGGVAF